MAAMGGSAAGADATRPDRVLGIAVERTYQVFASHRIGRSMVVRRRDVSAADVGALAGPVRSVAATVVDRWLPHAVTTWGAAEDLRALLPRVFELLTAGLLATPPEVVYAKLRQADLGSWPLEEVAAVEDVTAALWVATLTEHPAALGHPAVRVLAAIAELGRDLSPHLDDWLLLLSSNRPDAGPARRHAGDLVRQADALLAAGAGLASLFWSPRPEEAARLERWVTSPLVRGHLPG